MPNIKSAKKRVEVIKKKTMRNNSIKSGYKTAIKKAEANSERRSQHSWKAPHFYTSLNECTFIQGCSSYNVYTIFCKGMQAVFLLGFFAL